MKAMLSVVIAAMFAGMAFPGWATDTAEDIIANRVKAAYLFKFATYAEWPSSVFPDDNAPVIIGVIGSDGMVVELGKLSVNHRINNRPVRIRQLKPDESLNGVHVLFVGPQDSGRLKHVLESIKSQPVLTVSESTGPFDDVCVINFVSREDRVGFEVSVVGAERRGLKISSRLLGVAQRIEGRGQ